MKKVCDLRMLQDNRDKKVVTRDGRPVRIVCTDATTEYPIIGIIGDTIQVYRKSGMPFKEGSEYDLFFADEEEELTEFEKAISEFIQKLTFNGNVLPSKDIKGYAKSLLDLARKELQPEFDKELDEAYKSRDEVVYLEGYDTGCEDTLKSLPKWKKAKEDRILSEDWVVKFNKDGKIIFSDVVHKGEYFIILQSLETLSKEE